MTLTVKAVYENGVLTPAEPLPPTGLRLRGPGGGGEPEGRGGGPEGRGGGPEGRGEGRRPPPFDGPPPFNRPRPPRE